MKKLLIFTTVIFTLVACGNPHRKYVDELQAEYSSTIDEIEHKKEIFNETVSIDPWYAERFLKEIEGLEKEKKNLHREIIKYGGTPRDIGFIKLMEEETDKMFNKKGRP